MTRTLLALALVLGISATAAGQPEVFAPDDDPHTGHAVPPDDPHAGHLLPPGEAPLAPPPAAAQPTQAEPRDPVRRPKPAADPHAGHAMPAQTARSPEAGGEEDGGHPDHTAPADPHADHPRSGGGAGHHNMTVDAAGMTMNHNPEALPRDCPAIAGEVELTVRAGREFAAQRPGWLYGYDQHVWKVPPCTRVNVTFENRDAVRHQWMVHGLPRYLYPMGMFTLEVYGPGSRSASFIVPSAAKTYLAHCDVPHHMEKGMKGQLVVAGGDGDLPSIPGVSAPLFPDTYSRYGTEWDRSALLLVAVAVGLGVAVSVALRRV